MQCLLDCEAPLHSIPRVTKANVYAVVKNERNVQSSPVQRRQNGQRSVVTLWMTAVFGIAHAVHPTESHTSRTRTWDCPALPRCPTYTMATTVLFYKQQLHGEQELSSICWIGHIRSELLGVF